MKKISLVPWFIATIAVIASSALLFQLHEARTQISAATRLYSSLVAMNARNHLHYEVREFMIRAALADADRPIVVVGDSITEMARLPETIGDRPVINAGIGGATIEDFQLIATELLQNSNAPLIAVALGTNDSGSMAIQKNYAALLRTLKSLSPRLLSVGVPPQVGADMINAQIKAAAESEGVPFIEEPLSEGMRMVDHIHLNAAGYAKWTPALVAAISAAIS